MRFFLEIQYNGTNYHGWQRQNNAVSVQEILDHALSTILREPIESVASGRTDTGVHCQQQFVHFDTENIAMIPKLKQRLNALLPFDIAITSIQRVVPDAHARFSAISRAYRYYVHQQKSPFFHPVSYYYFKEVSVERMNEAAQLLCQYKDFTVFSKTHTDVKTFLCDVQEAHWQVLDNGQLLFYIKSNRFLRGMVRLITGTLLDIGSGRRSIAELKQWMEEAKPVIHKHSAAAQGLFLYEVTYPSDIFEESLLPK